MSEMKMCIIRLIILSSVLSGTDTTNEAIIVQPSVAITLIDDSAVFNCSTTSGKVEWLIGSDHDQPIIYSYEKVNDPYKDRFHVQSYIKNYTKWFSLILRSVTTIDAGLYICRDPANVNIDGREVHLTVLETQPVCSSKVTYEGLKIEPNSCAIKPETVQLTCSVTYTGDHVPELQWTKADENTAINLSRCSDAGNITTCNLTMDYEFQMEEGSSYICQTTQSMTKNYNCTSGVFRLIYIFVEHTELTGRVNETVNCSVNSSSQSCTSSWIFENGTTNWTESYEEVIKFERPGRFICQAFCVIGKNNCTFPIMTVIVTVSEEPSGPGVDKFRVGKIVAIVVVVFAICVIMIAIYRCKRKRKDTPNGSYLRSTTQPDALYRQGPSEDIALLSVEKARDGTREQTSPSTELVSVNVEHVTGAVDGDIVLQNITPMVDENRNRRVRGLAILNDELFLAFETSSIIEAVQIHFLTPWRKFVVTDLLAPGTIAACASNSCLYVIDQIMNSRKKIFKLKPDGNVVHVWETDDHDRGRISVNRAGNIVMTVYDKRKVKIYSPEGKLLTERTIDFSGTHITLTFYTINLADGNFIIGHGTHKCDVHQVCKFDSKGNILRAFGDKKGCSDAELNCPAYLAERKDGSIIVADQDNDRILLLNSKLEFVKVLFTKDNCNVSLPEVMFVYEENEPALLFLGCNKQRNSGGYVLVLRLDQ